MNKVLVIDDEIKMGELIQGIFIKEKNLKVICAITGMEGLNIFYKEKPDIVILDLFLGDMTGFEILERIKICMPSCYVILVTASHSEENKKLAFTLGADNYLTKPFHIDDMKNIVFNS